MISKEEREKDAAILAAATPEWKQGHHINNPRALCSARQPSASLLAIDREIGPIFEREPDARAAVTAVNRLPLYIAALADLETVVEATLDDVRVERREKFSPGAVEGHVDYQDGQIEAYKNMLRILRGGQ